MTFFETLQVNGKVDLHFALGNAWRIYQGFCLAWDLGHHKIDLQTDRKLAGYAITSALVHQCFNLDLIQATQGLLHCEWEVVIRHVFQEGNALVDFTANKGFSLGEEFISFGSPPIGA